MATDTTSEAVAAEEVKLVDDRTIKELCREIIELESRSPLPDYDAWVADAKWLQAHQGTPEFEPYRGTHIAILREAIVGRAWNCLQLELDIARKYNVHPRQVLIVYVPPRL